MEEICCSHCGASNFRTSGDILVCNYCSTSYSRHQHTPKSTSTYSTPQRCSICYDPLIIGVCEICFTSMCRKHASSIGKALPPSISQYFGEIVLCSSCSSAINKETFPIFNEYQNTQLPTRTLSLDKPTWYTLITLSILFLTIAIGQSSWVWFFLSLLVAFFLGLYWFRQKRLDAYASNLFYTQYNKRDILLNQAITAVNEIIRNRNGLDAIDKS